MPFFCFQNSRFSFIFSLLNCRRVQCRYIQDVVPYLDNEPLIERYSWFSYNSDYTGESSLINEATGELTPLGECYVGA